MNEEPGSRQLELTVTGKRADLQYLLADGSHAQARMVLLGQRTSKMTVREMKDLIDLAYAFGNERGVEWSRTSLGRDA